MNHRVETVIREQALKRRFVAHIGALEQQLAAGDSPHPSQRFLAAVAQIIDHHDLVAGIQQLDAGVAADITGSAGD